LFAFAIKPPSGGFYFHCRDVQMDSFTVSTFLHVALRILLVAGLAGFVIALGERAIGLDIRGAVDAIEKRAGEGDVWPITALLGISILALAYILG